MKFEPWLPYVLSSCFKSEMHGDTIIQFFFIYLNLPTTNLAYLFIFVYLYLIYNTHCIGQSQRYALYGGWGTLRFQTWVPTKTTLRRTQRQRRRRLCGKRSLIIAQMATWFCRNVSLSLRFELGIIILAIQYSLYSLW